MNSYSPALLYRYPVRVPFSLLEAVLVPYHSPWGAVQSVIKLVRVLVSYSLANDGNATGMYGLRFPRNAAR
eukprot:scaffold510909_cov18-Prasinocladus_malaysianus.AAC.1